MFTRKTVPAFSAIGLFVLLAASAGAAGYYEVATIADLNAGNPDLTSHTMTIYEGGVAYSHMAKTSLPRDYIIGKTTFPGGVPTTSALTTLAGWTADVGAPNGDRIFTGYGSAVVGSSLQIVNSNNGAGEGVYRINTTTGTVSTYLTEADITAVTGATDPDIQNWSGVSATGEAVFYEGNLDEILITNGAGSVTTLADSAALTAAQGNDLIGSGFEFDGSGNLFWGNNTTDSMFMLNGGGVITEVLSKTALESVLGADNHSFSGDVFFGPDGLMYFRYGSSATRSILSFDPAAPDPEASIAVVVSNAELLAGPAANSSVGPFSWYEGNLAWTTFTGGYYTIPEPATFALLGLGGLLGLRRR